MNLLLLPGKNIRNKQWLAEVAQALSPEFDGTFQYDLAVWESDEDEIDLQAEVRKLAGDIAAFAERGPYCVFAKSAGTILACLAADGGVISPEACVFAGFPLRMVQRFDLPAEAWLRRMDVPIVIAQNTADPIGPYAEVKAYVDAAGCSTIAVYELAGDTHDYTDLAQLRAFARQVRGKASGTV